MPRRMLLACGALALAAAAVRAETVAVRHPEGIVHGFLALRTLDGTTIADGDLIQLANGNRITSRLTFRFRDGSLHDETTVFSGRGTFRLISDHLVQKGASFPRPLEMWIDAGRRTIRVHDLSDEHQPDIVVNEQLPADLCNGMLFTLLKNIRPEAPPKSLSFVVATPKPRVIKLELGSGGEERFSTGGQRRTAAHYILKAELGGLTGLLAPIFGKQPPDSHVWILGGEAPAFVRSEQPFYAGGPLWRIELVSPSWRDGAALVSP
jgi:hypothetical protein